jgi:hypothetical protein
MSHLRVESANEFSPSFRGFEQQNGDYFGMYNNLLFFGGIIEKNGLLTEYIYG